MSNHKQGIINYGNDIQDLDISPYEHLRMLHDRTAIEKNINELDKEEKYLLHMYDFMLLSKYKELLQHIHQPVVVASR